MNDFQAIKDYLEKNDYKFYSKVGPCFPYSDGFYQKKFTDSKGVKYYLEFVYYFEMKFDNGTKAEPSFMAHLNINEPHQTYQIHHINNLDKIIEAEKKIEEFWKIFGDYYEVFKNRNKRVGCKVDISDWLISP
jgi:hypothetical protein